MSLHRFLEFASQHGLDGLTLWRTPTEWQASCRYEGSSGWIIAGHACAPLAALGALEASLRARDLTGALGDPLGLSEALRRLAGLLDLYGQALGRP